jgi:hypothetical protein
MLLWRLTSIILKIEAPRASDGDMTAARLVLERIAPPRRGRPVHFNLPEISDAASILSAQAALLRAVVTGEMTPEEAEPISAMLGAYLTVVEAVDIERHLSELEGKLDAKNTMAYRK